MLGGEGGEVNTKKDLLHPYLQIHHKINSGYRTISPNGKFTMIIHSPPRPAGVLGGTKEYFNALKDYDISIKNGYFFRQENIFEKFTEDLYELRNKYPKGDPMNYTCKLILNSLYGRFEMRPITARPAGMTRIYDKRSI